MRSKIFDYLPKEDREFIEEWIKVQVEKNTQSYSRFDRFLTFVERGATGVKNAVSGTANWVVETISKIGFHILVANVAYFGLTHGAEWYNGKLIETMNENRRLTEQLEEELSRNAGLSETNSYLSSAKDDAWRRVEEMQAELDNANKRLKTKKAAKPKAPVISKEEAEYRECVINKMRVHGSLAGRIDYEYAWDCAEYPEMHRAYPASRVISPGRQACVGKNTEFKSCWVSKLNSGLGKNSQGESYLLSKDAIDCWDRACQ